MLRRNKPGAGILRLILGPKPSEAVSAPAAAGLPLLLGGELLVVVSVALFIIIGFRATARRRVPAVMALTLAE